MSGPRKQGNTVETLVGRLADEIVEGGIGPGVKLDEQSLADRFQVSRTPVREALNQLAAIGLVEKRPHRGVVVATPTREWLLDLFEVMGELEAACSRFAAERMTAAERADLRTLHNDSRKFVEADDLAGYEKANRAFHQALYDGTHNPALVETTLEIRRRLAPFRKAQFRVGGRLGLSYDEHEAVVSAVERGEGETAYKAMRRHILTVRDASADQVRATWMSNDASLERA